MVPGPWSLVPRSRSVASLAHLLWVCSVFVCLVPGSVVRAQQPFRTGTRLVAIYATVIDSTGKLVTELPKDAFTVYDNGKAQPLAVFANDPQPITMTTMLDTSGSMTQNIGMLRTATMALVSYLKPDDRVRLGTFGGKITLSPDFTNDGNALARFVWERLRPGGGTPLWDAVDIAMDSLEEKTGRRVVLVFTDGRDSQSRRSLKDDMRRAEQQEFMIYAIGCWGTEGGGRPGGAPKLEPPDEGLREIAEQTGGGYTELRWTDDLNASFQRVAEELHSQYLLGFVPEKTDGKIHKLEVKLNRPGLTVRTRKSYVATP